jgi:hypothetical protein
LGVEIILKNANGIHPINDELLIRNAKVMAKVIAAIFFSNIILRDPPSF